MCVRVCVCVCACVCVCVCDCDSARHHTARRQGRAGMRHHDLNIRILQAIFQRTGLCLMRMCVFDAHVCVCVSVCLSHSHPHTLMHTHSLFSTPSRSSHVAEWNSSTALTEPHRPPPRFYHPRLRHSTCPVCTCMCLLPDKLPCPSFLSFYYLASCC